jgi:hypothetical protein
LRSQAARFAYSLFLLAFLPLCGDLFTVRAGFVVEVVPIGDEDVAKENLSRGTAVVRSDGSSETNQPSSELAKSLEVWLAMLRNSQRDTGNGPSKPGPMPRGPQPPSENQGCQGAGGGTNATGLAVHPAGLPATPVIIGPDLAMRLLAREAHFKMEDLAGRLFRPPRSL